VATVAPSLVRVVGSVGGAPLDAAGALSLTDRAVRVRLDGGEVALTFDGLDGADTDGLVLVLVGRDGAALRFEGLPNAAMFADEVLERGATVPEFTRGLRAFASVRGDAGSDHDVFFTPLLAARRAVHAATTTAARLHAVVSDAVIEQLSAARIELATRRFPNERDAGDRRALQVELEELQAPLIAALLYVDHAADAWRTTPRAARLRAWRDWCRAFTAVWEAADAAWMAALPALADSRGAEGAMWRRVLKRGPA
jgi:hypothetical protein